MSMCIVFHKWGKWKEYQRIKTVRGYLYPPEGARCVDRRQKRVCQECGKTQDVGV